MNRQSLQTVYPNGDYFRSDDAPPPTKDGNYVLAQFIHPVKGHVTLTADIMGGIIQQFYATCNGGVERLSRCACSQLLRRHARANGLLLPADPAPSQTTDAGPPPPPPRSRSPQTTQTHTHIAPDGSAVQISTTGSMRTITSCGGGTCVICTYQRGPNKINPKTHRPIP